MRFFFSITSSAEPSKPFTKWNKKKKLLFIYLTWLGARRCFPIFKIPSSVELPSSWRDSIHFEFLIFFSCVFNLQQLLRCSPTTRRTVINLRVSRESPRWGKERFRRAQKGEIGVAKVAEENETKLDKENRKQWYEKKGWNERNSPLFSLLCWNFKIFHNSWFRHNTKQLGNQEKGNIDEKRKQEGKQRKTEKCENLENLLKFQMEY